jgi:hypothetical protein
VITLSWLLIIALVGGALALVDGILRLRGRGSSTIIGVIEIIVAALFLLSLFLPVVALIIGGRTRRAITIAALVFLVVWLILENRWLVIPGVN